MNKILFVCHGNICRSPMAEFRMKDLLLDEGLYDRFEIASAATSTEEIGNPVYPPARRELERHGIDCSGKRARQFLSADYDYYDFIVGMDQANITNLIRLTHGDPEGKVSLLLDHVPPSERQFYGRSVADPWYTGDFQATWRDVDRGCRALLDKFKGRK